jgi:exo-beta-1,3-glucanase (GH17 family)
MRFEQSWNAGAGNWVPMRRPHRRSHAVVLVALLAAMVLPACREPGDPPTSEDPLGDAWQGLAIAYSGYREGQSPDTGVHPSQDQVAEDLRILARNWRLIRVYGADRHGEDVLAVIRREKIDLKVMLGIWLGREPGAEQSNTRQIADGIRLAREYKDIVVAVNIGNEVLIEWTAHPVHEDQVIRYVREVKAGVTQPVTVADNYVWWRDHGTALAREVDFITIHTYPLWERKDMDEGLSYTVANYEDVRAVHPGRTIVIGEAGWASYTEGNLHVPRGGDERKQQRYYEELTDWARDNKVTVFFFEAFDEPWKGTGTEGHWGLFTVDRQAKPVMQKLYPELMPDGPTSPSYPDRIAVVGADIAVALRADLAEVIRNGSVNPLGSGVSTSGAVPIEEAGGGTALRLVFSGESWGGVYFFLSKYDASAAGVVAMRLRLPDEVAVLEVKLEGPETNSQSVNLIEHAAGRDEAGWRTFSVPLAEFNEIDLSQVAILGLWNPSDKAGALVSCEVIVDDIYFE